MSTGGITEFLIELNETDSLAALQGANSQKSALVFKVDNYPNPIKTTIDNFSDKRVILLNDLNEFVLPLDKEISIKFNVGTEVYFIKTFIKSYLNRYYFDMSSKVIQLRRRKEPRYVIPKKWEQTACIILNILKQDLLKCTVLDISLSGIRLEIFTPKKSPIGLIYKRDDIIKIKFQIYKRAEMTTTAIVRFILNRPNLPTLIGLEFANMTAVQKERVANIVEDIGLLSSAACKD